jgi:hypothetical protein
LLELHTLSVNGGYTQRDVTEAAKVFTGWTIDKPNEGGGFNSIRACTSPDRNLCWGIASNPRAKTKAGNCCIAGNQPADCAFYFAEAG